MKKFGNILWGVVLIALGLIFGLNATGVANINVFFDGWWTLFIIVPCFIGIFKENEKTGNVIGLLIGIALLLCCQSILDFDMVWKLFIPAALVIVGLSFIFKDTIGGKVSKKIKELNKNRKEDDDCCAIFSGQKVNCDGQDFKGKDLTAVFGGIEYDLRKAIITSDQVINATAIFGGVDIFVPSNVKVKIQSTSIFGGASDKNKNTVEENFPTIYINATSIFGGVEVK